MSEWIDPHERLPQLHESVLVFDGKEVCMAYLNQNADGCYFTDGFNFLKVTHWMPMPEPPKEG